MGDDLDLVVVGPVDAADERDHVEATAAAVLEVTSELLPLRGRHPDRKLVELNLVPLDGGSVDLLEVGDELFGRHRFERSTGPMLPPTTIGSRSARSNRSLSDSFPISCWRRRMPSSSASGRGGQPGTYTSTGTI